MSAITSNKRKPKYPTEKVLMNALKLSLMHRKPIETCFYLDSLRGQISFAKDEDGEQVIYKCEDEYSSGISDIRVDKESGTYLVFTQNSIHILYMEHIKFNE